MTLIHGFRFEALSPNSWERVIGSGGASTGFKRLKPLHARGDPELCKKGGAAVRGRKGAAPRGGPRLGTLGRRPLSFEDMAGWGV